MKNELNEMFFYNALNVALESNWDKLEKAHNRFGAWSKAWQNLDKEKNSACDPEKEWGKLKTTGARLILRNNNDFPDLLKEIPNPPLGIYVIGNLASSEKNSLVAIVGTRKATIEGKNIAKQFSEKLARGGVVIVSGLALGIDAVAHAGCLETEGKTIAVLGCGIDKIYPSTNEHLAKKIAKSGAIISEYPPGAPALPYRFLERNRVVSGLCLGVIVVEAPEKSGALATARLAAEQNRDVFVIPGNISHPNYRGSNQLIRNGATLVTKPEEILETYGVKTSSNEPSATHNSGEEKLIWDTVKKFSSPVSTDEIGESTGLEAATINRTLTIMVIKSLLEETGGKYKIR